MREGALGAGDLAHLGAVANVDAELLQSRAPCAEHSLATAGAERQIAAQVEKAGLRHDVLTLLVALDRLGVGIEALEKNVARASCDRPVCREQPRGRLRSARRDPRR